MSQANYSTKERNAISEVVFPIFRKKRKEMNHKQSNWNNDIINVYWPHKSLERNFINLFKFYTGEKLSSTKDKKKSERN